MIVNHGLVQPLPKGLLVFQYGGDEETLGTVVTSFEWLASVSAKIKRTIILRVCENVVCTKNGRE